MNTSLENRDSEFEFLNIDGLEELSVGSIKSFEIPEERLFPRTDVFLRDLKGNLIGKARVFEFYVFNNQTIGKYKVTEIYPKND